MKCENHPHREARQLCAGCGKGLCGECSQAVILQEHYCFHCALFAPSPTGKRAWPPIRYVGVLSSVLIFVMGGVILLPGLP